MLQEVGPDRIHDKKPLALDLASLAERDGLDPPRRRKLVEVASADAENFRSQFMVHKFRRRVARRPGWYRVHFAHCLIF